MIELTFNLNAPPELSDKAVHAAAMIKLIELACVEAAKVGVPRQVFIDKIGGVIEDLWVE